MIAPSNAIDPEESWDVVIIGAGPSGSIAALELARAGKRVLVVDKESFPRFRIGESMLPHTNRVMEQLGLMDRVRELPHVVKRGLEISFGDGRRDPAAIPFERMLFNSPKQKSKMRWRHLQLMGYSMVTGPADKVR